MLIGTVLFIVALTIAFPLYQAFYTQGYVFYTNGVDEASYLSFPYSQLLLTWQGVTRYSSWLIIALHTLGLSGGYCNVALDVVCVITFFLATPRALKRYGFANEEASTCALLSFLLPLLATPWNPLIAEVKAFLYSSWLFEWITLAPNDELLFLRSPEPQLSWTIIALVLAWTPKARYIPWVLLVLSPFLYSFVRLPLLFVILVHILPRALPPAARFSLAFAGISALIAVFVKCSVSSDLQRFVVATHVPVVPLPALGATVLFFIVKKHIPSQWRGILSTLVVSTWIGANTQILSGWMISPSKYDEYWSVAVLALILSITIVSVSRLKRRWVVAATCIFALHSAQTFERNNSILARLDDPKGVIKLLKETPEHVAFDNLLLATTADLTHPRQEHTLLSFTRTYDLNSPENLSNYLCAKQNISAQGNNIAKRFTDAFFHLDWGYQQRGIDDAITMRRRPLDATEFSLSVSPLECAGPPPIVVTSRQASSN